MSYHKLHNALKALEEAGVMDEDINIEFAYRGDMGGVTTRAGLGLVPYLSDHRDEVGVHIIGPRSDVPDGYEEIGYALSDHPSLVALIKAAVLKMKEE